jgi:hypothetical protein
MERLDRMVRQQLWWTTAAARASGCMSGLQRPLCGAMSLRAGTQARRARHEQMGVVWSMERLERQEQEQEEHPGLAASALWRHGPPRTQAGRPGERGTQKWVEA